MRKGQKEHVFGGKAICLLHLSLPLENCAGALADVVASGEGWACLCRWCLCWPVILERWPPAPASEKSKPSSTRESVRGSRSVLDPWLERARLHVVSSSWTKMKRLIHSLYKKLSRSVFYNLGRPFQCVHLFPRTTSQLLAIARWKILLVCNSKMLLGRRLYQ